MWLFLLYVHNGFFKQTLKPFFCLPINHILILERFFFFEYHIFKYLNVNVYCQNHVNNNIVLHRHSHCGLFVEHGLRCVLIKVVIIFLFNGIADEIAVNDGTRFVYFFTSSFITRFSFYTTKLGRNSIHNYLLCVLKFVVQVVWILMAMLFGMFWFIALTIDHIYYPSFTSLLLLG